MGCWEDPNDIYHIENRKINMPKNPLSRERALDIVRDFMVVGGMSSLDYFICGSIRRGLAEVGDIDLIVGEEESGLIVKSLDTISYEAVLREIPDFCKSKDEIRNIGAKYYNLSKGVSSYLKIYNELLK